MPDPYSFNTVNDRETVIYNLLSSKILANGGKSKLHVLLITIICFRYIHYMLGRVVQYTQLRVDLSLVFVIWQIGNWFMNPIPSNQHKSFPLLLIRHAGNRFARRLIYSWSGLWEWVENVVNSSRFDRIDWSLWPRFKNEEGSCIVISRILSSSGWVENVLDLTRFNRINTNCFPCCWYVMPRRSICENATLCKSSWDVTCESRRIESYRKVPQTNRLSLGVLDMDDAWLKQCALSEYRCTIS